MAALPAELNPNDVGAIMRALQRREGGTPQPTLDQQGPGGASPAIQPPNVTAAPSAIPQGASAGQSQPVPDDEKILIIKALRDRLKAISNVEQGQQQGL